MTFECLYPELLALVSEVGARPDVPLESEIFFTDIIEAFPSSKEECLAYIRSNLQQWFRCIGSLPEWIQDADWPFSEGKPMIFVGQTEVPPGTIWFHDTAFFYHFWNADTGETRSIIQVS